MQTLQKGLLDHPANSSLRPQRPVRGRVLRSGGQFRVVRIRLNCDSSLGSGACGRGQSCLAREVEQRRVRILRLLQLRDVVLREGNRGLHVGNDPGNQVALGWRQFRIREIWLDALLDDLPCLGEFA